MKWVIRNLEEILSGVALLIIIFSVFYGVLSRYVIHRAATWSDELSTITFTWMVFIGASAAFKRKMHIGIDLLVRKVSPQLQPVLVMLANLIVLVFIGYITVMGGIFAVYSYKQPTSVLRIPNMYVYMAVPLGFGLMFLHQLIQIVRSIHKWFSRG